MKLAKRERFTAMYLETFKNERIREGLGLAEHNRACETTSLFFRYCIKGNELLLKSCGETGASQRRLLRARGIVVSKATVCRFKNGEYKTGNLILLTYFAHFHKVSIFDLHEFGRKWFDENKDK